jgi:hypothetical protein
MTLQEARPYSQRDADREEAYVSLAPRTGWRKGHRFSEKVAQYFIEEILNVPDDGWGSQRRIAMRKAKQNRHEKLREERREEKATERKRREEAFDQEALAWEEDYEKARYRESAEYQEWFSRHGEETIVEWMEKLRNMGRLTLSQLLNRGDIPGRTADLIAMAMERLGNERWRFSSRSDSMEGSR